jgi:phage terminase large subunit-like protein
MTLAPEREALPVIKVPRGPLRDWFLEEVRPLKTPAARNNQQYRRIYTKFSPLRFALTYLPHYLVLQGHEPPTATFNELHLRLAIAAKRWRRKERWRQIWVAPRGAAKTTWCFLILPLWALAHGHREYFMAFSYTAKMAEAQLATLRRELETNDLLRADYPELLPQRIRGAQNTSTTVIANGGTIRAAGLFENTLGAKSGANRPDLIICDDIQKLEPVITEQERDKIVTALTSSVIPMASPHAAIGIFGTTTSYNSPIHEATQHAREREYIPWVGDNDFEVRLFPGIITDPATGEERSLWPERWPLTPTHLGEYPRVGVDGRVPRNFELNYLLDPSPYGTGDQTEEGMFREGLIRYKTRDQLGGVFEHAMYIDTAPTSHSKSDRTAIVIVGRRADRRVAVIEYAWAGRVTARRLREIIHTLYRKNPTMRTVIVEVVHGHDLWREAIDPPHDPLPEGLVYQPESFLRTDKLGRVRQVIDFYETGRVFHADKFVELEREMLLFPNPKVHDDLVDALTGGLRWAFARRA